MPATRIDNARKAQERREERLRMYVRDAYYKAPQNARRTVLNVSASTVTRRLQNPQDLTLRELAQLMRSGYADPALLDSVTDYLKH